MQATRRARYTGPSRRRHAAGIAAAVREHQEAEREAKTWWLQARARHKGREDEMIARRREA